MTVTRVKAKRDCGHYYNCCDCGDNNCMCNGCWSCNACSSCLEYEGNEETNPDCENNFTN